MAVALTSPALSALPGLKHGFFTRRGGASGGMYSSLNCGPGSQDDPANVAANRALVVRSLGAEPGRLLTVHQVHGAIAVAATAPWLSSDQRPKADAMVTATRGLVLGALTADCTPVLFADCLAGVIGAAHAGWKGALAGIVESTVAAMEALGAQRHRICATIGPCIGREHYEVGEDFRQTFLMRDAGSDRFFHVPPTGGKPHFDLPAYVSAQLLAAEVGQIEDLKRCTYEDARNFYSFRRATHQGQADYGRQISAIVLD